MRVDKMGVFREKIIKLIPTNTRLGFYLKDTRTNETIAINEDEWFPLASIAKWVTAILVSGSNHTVNNEDVFLAISEHSNKSYMKLLRESPDLLLNELLKKLDIDCKVSLENRDIVNNIGTPKGLFRMMDLLFHEELKPDHRTNILRGMKNQTDPDGFRLTGKWSHMTGGLNGVCNDVGFIETIEGRVMVIGLLHCPDASVEWTDLEIVMNRVGDEVMKYIRQVSSSI